MPTGVYHHLDDVGEVVAVERFSCAPGPIGWRYAAEVTDAEGSPAGVVDLTCDAAWRQVRVAVASGSWVVRGGVAGGEAVWVRVPAVGETAVAPEAERRAAAVGFAARSPGFAVALARLCPTALASPSRVTVAEITEPSLAVVVAPQTWMLVDVSEHPTDLAPLVVHRYDVDDLATGLRRSVSVAGDVVVDAPGVELVTLDSPPTLW